MKKLIISLLCLTAPIFVGTQAAAATLLQHCTLNTVCSIPGNDGGITYYSITPQTGTQYRCNIKPDKGSMQVWIGSGKDFAFFQGGGTYNIGSLGISIIITGHFTKDSRRAEGQLKFSKLWGSSGKVVCDRIR